MPVDRKKIAKSIFNKALYSGKTIVVVGASGGINFGIARRFSELGAKVALLSRDLTRITAAAASLHQQTGQPVSGYAADVRDYEALEKAFTAINKEYGAFDVLISGAAGNFMAPITSMSSNGFKTIIDIDLNGTFNVVRSASEFMNETGASIINISAPQAQHPYPEQAHVSAAKSGINMLTKTLAMEWGERGIRINAISPGPIEKTEGMRRLSPTKNAEDHLVKNIPLGRYGRSSEIADLAVFLCSDAATYITGAVIPCDGGFELGGVGAWKKD